MLSPHSLLQETHDVLRACRAGGFGMYLDTDGKLKLSEERVKSLKYSMAWEGGQTT